MIRSRFASLILVVVFLCSLFALTGVQAAGMMQEGAVLKPADSASV